MPRAIDDFANSRFGLSLGIAIARGMPQATGRAVGRWFARTLAARRDSGVVRALRSNRWVVSGGQLTGEALDDAVRVTLQHQARCMYDTFRLLGASAQELDEAITLGPELTAWLQRNIAGEPLIVAAPHLSAFDLAVAKLGSLGVDAQVITPPAPRAGYRRQNSWREATGLRVTPASLESLRAAEKHLAAGGAIVTGVDRPLPGTERRVRFFGRPATLPTLHVRLAVHAGAPLIVPLVRGLEDGRYWVDVAGPVPLDPGRDAATMAANAERVLAIVETAVRERPDQWEMPHPVWPEALAELDALEAGVAPVGRAGESERA